jgi:shikimate kinase
MQLVSRLNPYSDTRPLLKNLKGENLLNFIGEKLAEREKWYGKSELVTDGFDLDVSSLVLRIKSHFRIAD